MLKALFNPPPLTTQRKWAALAVAVIADAAQIPLTAVPGAPQIVDAITMVVTSLVIGFHPLLLPTFILELVPLADMLPSWTGCVMAVILLRGRGPHVVDVESVKVPPPVAVPPPAPPPAAIPPKIDPTK
ncbi:MAG: hypothetical protein FJ386_11790 [Verrucomicrobia bacterium]|nr:hypothetical protein [Verrucomicrobiota bacterium]